MTTCIGNAVLVVALLGATAFASVPTSLSDDDVISEGLSLLQQRAQTTRVHSNQRRERFTSHGSKSNGIVRLLDFTKAKVLINNLGNQGPWKLDPRGEAMPAEIRIGNLVVGHECDLVITADEGYQAWNVSRNGILGGNGQINAKSGTTVNLQYTFTEAGTYTPYSLPHFYITFSDLDERHGGSEKEMIAVTGFSKYFTNDDLSVVGKDTSAPAFESVDYGNYADNDFHPDSPDPLQLTHAVTFEFFDKSTFSSTFIVSQDGDDIKGRNILFSGISQLVFCQEPSTYLDFKTSTLSINNLGGLGPETTNPAPEIRYTNAGTYSGQALDVVIGVDRNETKGWDYKPWNNTQNGLLGDFGMINLFTGKEETSSTVHLNFRVVATGTEDLVKLDAFAMMFFDFDTGLHEQQVEFIELSPSAAGFAGGSGYASYITTKTTELNITSNPDGNVKFMATKHGTVSDNPHSSQMLAREEADRSVVFTFRNTGMFKMAFGITPTGFDTGRNLMFAGQDMYLMCD